MKELIKKRAEHIAEQLNISGAGISEVIKGLECNYLSQSIDLKKATEAIDHTILSYNATQTDVLRICEEAGKNKFKAICINPVWIGVSNDFRKKNQHSFLIATVVDFPLGASSINARIAETKQAVADGADEIDIVVSIGLLKSGKIKETYQSLKEIMSETESYYKVILETSALELNEKIDGAVLAVLAGADMLKTSTGVNGKASVEDVRLLRMIAGERLGVKAAGGIRDKASLIQMMEAGADRIGCSSSVSIVQNW